MNITTDDILAAFAKTGLLPKQEEFFQEIDGKSYACGLGAFAIANWGADDIDVRIAEHFCDWEVEAIADGFDGLLVDKHPIDPIYDEYLILYNAGRDAAKALGLSLEGVDDSF